MKQINLVPVSVRKKAANQQLAPYLLFAGIVGLAAGGAAWAGFTAQRSLLEAEHTKLVQQEDERQRSWAAELESLEFGADIEVRVAQLNAMAAQELDWQKVFTYVNKILPKDLILSSYSVASAPTGTTLKITGEAPSNVSYATFAEYLKSEVGKQVQSFVVDGYSFDPRSGRVTFGVTIHIPAPEIRFTPQP
jgi:Tfp pilus assembly protein PilN